MLPVEMHASISMSTILTLQDPLTYEIVNSSPSVGENFFYLDPNTGVLTTKRLLTDTPDNLYQVSWNQART